MRIVEYYSHLNGYEHIIVHKPGIWTEIKEVIQEVDANKCKTKVCQEKGSKYGTLLFDPGAMNVLFKDALTKKDWKESRTDYYVTSDQQLIRKTMAMDKDEQRRTIEAAGKRAIYSYNQTDFVKDRIEIEVQLCQISKTRNMLFDGCYTRFNRGITNVAISLYPVAQLQRMISNDSPNYEQVVELLTPRAQNEVPISLVVVGVGA